MHFLHLNICHLFHRCLCYPRTLIVKWHHSWCILVGISIWTDLSQMSWSVKRCLNLLVVHCRSTRMNFMVNFTNGSLNTWITYMTLRSTKFLTLCWGIYCSILGECDSFIYLLTYSMECVFSQGASKGWRVHGDDVTLKCYGLVLVDLLLILQYPDTSVQDWHAYQLLL